MEDQELRELQEELSRLSSLQSHAGYAYLLEIAGAQMDARKQQVFLTPLNTMDEVLRQEYAKGEIAGIDLFSKIVDVRIRDLQEEIQERLKDNEHESE